MLERWRELDVFHETIRRREGSAAVRLLRGPADRQRPPGLPPRAGARLQGHLPALQDHARLLRATARRAGTPTACRSSSRSSASSASTRRTRSRRYGDRGVQRELPRVGAHVRGGVEPAHRADRLLDRPRRRLRDLAQRVHRVGLVVAQADLGRRTCSTRATRSCPTARAAARRCPSHEVALGYQDVVDPSRLRALPAARAARSRGDHSSVWTTTPWTLRLERRAGGGPGC